uniref:Uncharacterized protein n=1 Tax=Hyaloperonospora arabidopsidis (strain Emoy2) TaxID=559515 RepID=M4B3U3_HYAAE
MCNPFTLEQAISVAEQENFSLLQDYRSTVCQEGQRTRVRSWSEVATTWRTVKNGRDQ